MKRNIVFMVLFSCFTIVYSQDYFMYVGGEKHYFEISPNKMLVQFVENTETDTVKNIIEKNMFFQVSNIAETDYKEWYLISFLNTDRAKIMELAQNKDKNLHFEVVFIDENGEKIAALTNQVIVRLKRESDYLILQKSIEAYKIDNVRQAEFEKKHIC